MQWNEIKSNQMNERINESMNGWINEMNTFQEGLSQHNDIPSLGCLASFNSNYQPKVYATNDMQYSGFSLLWEISFAMFPSQLDL